MTAMDAGTRPIITLDGPAASGKSSAAKAVAARLGIAYVSSGLLYRAATHMALQEGVPLDDEAALLAMLGRHDVRLVPDAQQDRITVDGEDVAHLLHTDAIDARVSEVAKLDGVRAWVTDRLRELEGPFVIDGRDMGTAVFPDARWKFYLTASPEVRAKRRVGERSADLAAVAEAIRLRDERDAKQSVPAPDAIHLDTSPLTLEAVVDFVYSKVVARWPEQLSAATA
jgi:cytidylate kinase